LREKEGNKRIGFKVNKLYGRIDSRINKVKLVQIQPNPHSMNIFVTNIYNKIKINAVIFRRDNFRSGWINILISSMSTCQALKSIKNTCYDTGLGIYYSFYLTAEKESSKLLLILGLNNYNSNSKSKNLGIIKLTLIILILLIIIFIIKNIIFDYKILIFSTLWNLDYKATEYGSKGKGKIHTINIEDKIKHEDISLKKEKKKDLDLDLEKIKEIKEIKEIGETLKVKEVGEEEIGETLKFKEVKEVLVEVGGGEGEGAGEGMEEKSIIKRKKEVNIIKKKEVSIIKMNQEEKIVDIQGLKFIIKWGVVERIQMPELETIEDYQKIYDNMQKVVSEINSIVSKGYLNKINVNEIKVIKELLN